MEEIEPYCTTNLQYLRYFYYEFKSIWLLYLDLEVKAINEAKETCITAETMINHFVQYDFLSFTPSADEKEVQA